MTNYVGRFAPSPTGPLHMGSLVCALASWLDAKAHGGKWLIRIEDVDTTRAIQGMDQLILQQLAALGMQSNDSIMYQSTRSTSYAAVIETLTANQLVYRCDCSRRKVQLGNENHTGIYLGHCRLKNQVWPIEAKTAWRFKTTSAEVIWQDRRLGAQSQNVATEVGDFVLQRADGIFAYQLAVVVDDAAQGVTHVVRGADLLDNTARQIVLQEALGLSRLNYLHVPLVLASDGQKLSKQNGAKPLDLSNPMETLSQAATHLGLLPATSTIGESLLAWTAAWSELYN